MIATNTAEMLARIDRLERVRRAVVAWLYANAPSRTGRPCPRWHERETRLAMVEGEIKALLLAL